MLRGLAAPAHAHPTYRAAVDQLPHRALYCVMRCLAPVVWSEVSKCDHRRLAAGEIASWQLVDTLLVEALQGHMVQQPRGWPAEPELGCDEHSVFAGEQTYRDRQAKLEKDAVRSRALASTQATTSDRLYSTFRGVGL